MWARKASISASVSSTPKQAQANAACSNARYSCKSVPPIARTHTIKRKAIRRRRARLSRRKPGNGEELRVAGGGAGPTDATVRLPGVPLGAVARVRYGATRRRRNTAVATGDVLAHFVAADVVVQSGAAPFGALVLVSKQTHHWPASDTHGVHQLTARLDNLSI